MWIGNFNEILIGLHKAKSYCFWPVYQWNHGMRKCHMFGHRDYGSMLARGNFSPCREHPSSNRLCEIWGGSMLSSLSYMAGNRWNCSLYNEDWMLHHLYSNLEIIAGAFIRRKHISRSMVSEGKKLTFFYWLLDWCGDLRRDLSCSVRVSKTQRNHYGGFL